VNSLNVSRYNKNKSFRSSIGNINANLSITTSPGRKDKSNRIIEETEINIPNQNKLKLRKADTFNTTCISNSWIDLNISCQNYKNEKETLND